MIVFEGLTFTRFLACLPQVLKEGGHIYIVDHDGPNYRTGDFAGVIARCRKLAPGLRVTYVRHADFPDQMYRSNDVLTALVTEIGGEMAASPACRMIEKIYPGRGAFVALQRGLVARLRHTVHFVGMARRVAAGDGPVWMVPAMPDSYGIIGRIGGGSIPVGIRVLDGFRALTNLLRAPLNLLATMTAQSIRPVADLPPPVATDFAVQVVWPVGSQQNRRTREDCFFLENGAPALSKRILYCFGDWSLDPAADEATRAAVTARGSQSCDTYGNRPTWSHVWRHNVLRLGLGSLPAFFSGLLRGPRGWDELEWGLRTLRFANVWEIFCLHFRPKVFLSYDDQRPSHIARTMVFERHGLLNTGLHHPAFAGSTILPDLAFLHFHLRFLYGAGIRRDFAPFWDQTPFVESGPFRADLIYSAQNDDATKAAFERKYGGRTNILVGLSDPVVPLNLTPRYEAFCDALATLAERRADLHFILRPRPGFAPAESVRVRLDRLVKIGRASMELTEFDTFELIAFCKLVIAPTSSMVMEAIHAGRQVVSYCFNGADDFYPYRHTDPVIAAADAADLVALVEQRLDHPPPHFDALRDDIAAWNYGKVVPTIAQALERLLAGESPQAIAVSHSVSSRPDRQSP